MDPIIEYDITNKLLSSLHDRSTELEGIIIVTHDLEQTSIADHIILFRCYSENDKLLDKSHIKVFSKNAHLSALESMGNYNNQNEYYNLYKPWCDRAKPFITGVIQ